MFLTKKWKEKIDESNDYITCESKKIDQFLDMIARQNQEIFLLKNELKKLRYHVEGLSSETGSSTSSSGKSAK